MIITVSCDRPDFFSVNLGSGLNSTHNRIENLPQTAQTFIPNLPYFSNKMQSSDVIFVQTSDRQMKKHKKFIYTANFHDNISKISIITVQSLYKSIICVSTLKSTTSIFLIHFIQKCQLIAKILIISILITFFVIIFFQCCATNCTESP